MSEPNNSLKDIPLESLEILRYSYKVDWPKYVLAFNFIDNMIKRYEKFPDHREIVKILSINGVVDGTFIGTMVREKRKLREKFKERI